MAFLVVIIQFKAALYGLRGHGDYCVNIRFCLETLAMGKARHDGS